MQLDIRLPIGLMFSLLGAILTIYGAITASDKKALEPSLGININLWWGLFILLFGVVMLLLARLGKKAQSASGQVQHNEPIAR